MEPNNNQMLLLFSFFTFIILTPARCLIAPAPNSANMQPVSHPGSEPTPSSTPNAAPTPEPTSAWIRFPRKQLIPPSLVQAPFLKPLREASLTLGPSKHMLTNPLKGKQLIPPSLAQAPFLKPLQEASLTPGRSKHMLTNPLEGKQLIPPSLVQAPFLKPLREASLTPSPSKHMLTNPLKEMRILKESIHSNRLYQTVHPYRVPSIARNPELKKICDSTDYPSLCLTFVAPFCKHKSDPISMLEMAIRTSASQIRLTIAAADKLVHDHANNLPTTVSRLGHCMDSYRDALDNLQSAMDAIPDHDFGTVNSMLSAAVTDVSYCDGAFVGMAQYSNYDGHLTKMVSNCLAIASFVK